MPYTRITLEQGTAEWLAWRTQGIGASEAPAILGENPWKSRRALLAEKTGGPAPDVLLARAKQ